RANSLTRCIGQRLRRLSLQVWISGARDQAVRALAVEGLAGGNGRGVSVPCWGRKRHQKRKNWKSAGVFSIFTRSGTVRPCALDRENWEASGRADSSLLVRCAGFATGAHSRVSCQLLSERVDKLRFACGHIVGQLGYVIVHDEMDHIVKEKSGPAVDLEEPPEPLPVLLPQRGIRDLADQAGKEAKALDRGLDFRPQPARRDPPPAA